MGYLLERAPFILNFELVFFSWKVKINFDAKFSHWSRVIEFLQLFNIRAPLCFFFFFRLLIQLGKGISKGFNPGLFGPPSMIKKLLFWHIKT